MNVYDACKLISNDVGMKMEPTRLYDLLTQMCENETISKFSCDVIKSNWNTLWKQFIVDFVSGHYCNIFQ